MGGWAFRGKRKRRSWYTSSYDTTQDNKNDMRKYTTDPLRTGREIENADALDTLGGDFGLCWNDTVPLTTGAHNAFLSAFFEAGGVFDHLVDTCPLRLTSNNAPTNRETLGTVNDGEGRRGL